MNLSSVTLLLLLMIAAPSLCQESKRKSAYFFQQQQLPFTPPSTAPQSENLNEVINNNGKSDDYSFDVRYDISPSDSEDTSEDIMDVCDVYQPDKNTCDKCQFPTIDHIEAVNNYSLSSGNPASSYLNRSVAENNLIFAVMTYKEDLHMVWNYSEYLPFASQISVTAYGSLTRNETFLPIDTCCGVALDTDLRICNVGEPGIFESYYVRVSFLRSTFTTFVYERNRTMEDYGRYILTAAGSTGNPLDENVPETTMPPTEGSGSGAEVSDRGRSRGDTHLFIQPELSDPSDSGLFIFTGADLKPSFEIEESGSYSGSGFQNTIYGGSDSTSSYFPSLGQRPRTASYTTTTINTLGAPLPPILDYPAPEINPDTARKLLHVESSVSSLSSFNPDDRYKYTCLFNMPTDDVMKTHESFNENLSFVYNREVYNMPQHKYINNTLYDADDNEVKCSMNYDTTVYEDLEFKSSNPNTLTCLSLVWTLNQNDSYRDVFCLPHQQNDYRLSLSYEDSNKGSFIIVVSVLVMVVVLLLVIASAICVRKYLKLTRHSDMEIPETLAEVCKQKKSSIGDFIHWDLPATLEENPTAIDTSDAQIYHQAVDLQSDEQPSRSVSISYVTIKFQSDSEDASSTSTTSRDNINQQRNDDVTKKVGYEDDGRESGIGESTSSRDSPRCSGGGDGYSPKEALEYKTSSTPSHGGAVGGLDNAVFESDEDTTTPPLETVVCSPSPYMDKRYGM